MKRWMSAIGIVGVAGAAAGTVCAQELIKIDGSSTVYPITEAVAEEFQKKNGAEGHGRRLRHGRRLQEVLPRRDRHRRRVAADQGRKERAPKAGIEYIELPVALDALTVVVNPENDWVDHLTVAELKKIWEPAAQGKVTKWSQVREGLPDAAAQAVRPRRRLRHVRLLHRGDRRQGQTSRGDYTASEDDNVLVQGMPSDQNALGYFGSPTTRRTRTS